MTGRAARFEWTVALACAGGLALWFALVYGPWLPELASRTLAPVGQALARTIAAVACLVVARRAPMPERMRSAFYAFAAAHALYGAGDWTWTWMEAVQARDPTYTDVNYLYFSFYAVLAWGLVRLRLTMHGGRLGTAFMVDCALVALAVGFVAWRVLIAPPLERGLSADDWVVPVTLGYPVADALCIVLATLSVWRLPRVVLRPSLVLMAFALVLNTAGDTIWVALASAGVYETGGWSDAFWTTSATAFVAASVRLLGTRPLEIAPLREGAAGVGSAAIAACATIVSVMVGGFGSADDQVLVASVWALAALGVVRQRVRARERRSVLSARHVEASTRHLAALVDLSPQPIVAIDRDGLVTFASASTGALLGVDAASMPGRPLADWLVAVDRDVFDAGLERARSDRPRPVRLRATLAAHGERRVGVECRITDLVDDPEVGAVVVRIEDVGERRELEAELTRQALFDSMTGLANRDLVSSRLEQALAGQGRNRATIAALYLDLDGFKPVNDSHGHAVGDALLRELARRLCAALGPGESAGRLGGDEFVVVMENPPDARAAMERSAALVEAISGWYTLESIEVDVRMSGGLSVSGPDSGPESLLQQADAAMYAAKRQGGARVCLFDQTLARQIEWRRWVRSCVSSALAEGGFRVEYQPLVDTATGRVFGVEALLRWVDADDKPSIPSVIAEAESTGLIQAIGRFVLRRALTELAPMLAPDTGSIEVVNVNLSWLQLDDPGFPRFVAQCLAETAIPAHRLVFELTESAMPNAERQHHVRLREIRALGVSLALDDFGTGASSFSTLLDLDVRLLKLPYNIVAAMGTGHRLADLGRSIVAMTRRLGLVSVAEGVETAEQLQALREAGCTLVQGFLIARPMRADELPGWRPVDPRRFHASETPASRTKRAGMARQSGLTTG